MLKGGIPIGRIFGVKVNLHTSWFIIFFLILPALEPGNENWRRGFNQSAVFRFDFNS